MVGRANLLTSNGQRSLDEGLRVTINLLGLGLTTNINEDVCLIRLVSIRCGLLTDRRLALIGRQLTAVAYGNGISNSFLYDILDLDLFSNALRHLTLCRLNYL